MGHYQPGDSSLAGLTGLFEGEERRPRHQPVVAHRRQQRHVALVEDEPGVLTHTDQGAGQVDEQSGLAIRAHRHGDETTGSQ